MTNYLPRRIFTIPRNQIPLDPQGHPVGPGVTVMEVEEMVDRPILPDYRQYVDRKMMTWHHNRL